MRSAILLPYVFTLEFRYDDTPRSIFANEMLHSKALVLESWFHRFVSPLDDFAEYIAFVIYIDCKVTGRLGVRNPDRWPGSVGRRQDLLFRRKAA